MTRNTEPQLIAPEGMGESERASLALFLAVVQEHAAETAGVIKSYNSPAELLVAAESGEDGDTVSSKILRAAGPFFQAEVDLEVDVDYDTGAAMRRGIDAAVRHEAAGTERRRIIRMAVFAGEVATWRESTDMIAHVDGDGPTAVSQGSGYQRPDLVIAYLDDPLPETA